MISNPSLPTTLSFALWGVFCGCVVAPVEGGGSTGNSQTDGSSTGLAIGSTTGSAGQPETASPRITCLPASLSFGAVPAHQLATLPLTCTSVGPFGSLPLIIDPPLASPRVFSAQFDPADFPNPSAGLEPGQTARIFVHYDPTAESANQGTLDIPNNAGDDVRIPLSGEGLPPLPCQFTVSATSLDFGTVQVGDFSPALSFDVQNVGDGPCTVENLLIQDDATSSFRILTTSVPPDPRSGQIVLLPPDAGVPSDLTVSLDFVPTTPADSLTADATFTVHDSSGTPEPLSLALSGIAPYPDESHCLEVSPPSYFGQVIWPLDAGGELCTANNREIRFLDNCQASVRILSVTLESTSGDSVPQFAIEGPTPPLVLVTPALYEISFIPTSPGLHSAQLDVVHTSQHSATEIHSTLSLSGETVPPPSETDSFIATSSPSYPLLGTPLFANAITVDINGTRVAQLDGPNQPDWTYDAKNNAIVLTYRVPLKVGDAIAVTYPIGCK